MPFVCLLCVRVSKMYISCRDRRNMTREVFIYIYTCANKWLRTCNERANVIARSLGSAKIIIRQYIVASCRLLIIQFKITRTLTYVYGCKCDETLYLFFAQLAATGHTRKPLLQYKNTRYCKIIGGGGGGRSYVVHTESHYICEYRTKLAEIYI